MVRNAQVHVEYLSLVAKKAREEWFRLPPQTRAYVALEDMIQEGLLHVVSELVPRYKKKKACLTTWLWWGLENFYKNRNYYYFAKKRFDGKTAPLTEVWLTVWDEDNTIDELTALSALRRALYLASQPLREEVVRWLLTPKATKFHIHGRRFRARKKEFLQVSKVSGFGYKEMHFLMTTESWKRRAGAAVCKYAHVPC